MRIRNLYLSIYLTVVAVLGVFALVAAVLLHRHSDAEHERIEQAVSQRALAWAQLIEKALPPATASENLQREALLDWGRRLRLAMALEAADGRRIAASELFVDAQNRIGSGNVRQPARVALSDGRVLVMLPLRRPPGHFGPGVIGGTGDWRLRLAEPGAQGGGPVEAQPGPNTGNTAPNTEGVREPGPDDEMGSEPSAGEGSRGVEQDRPGPPRGERWRRDGLLGWLDDGGTLLAPLALLFVAIAAGSYPVVRRLTRRLEALKLGVETFGSGQLSHRVPEDGGDEVAALATSFNRAAQQVEDLVRAHRSLLANASHELRSPLARMKMALSMLDSAPAEQRAALRAEVHRDIRELDALVEEVLLASRLEAQTPVADDPFDLLGMAAEQAARVDALLDVDESARGLDCRGDERLVRRALRNLLENARRYGGDEVSLQVSHSQPGEPVVLTVCDRGPGVPEAERERIFDPFYRLPGHSEHAGGVGLGLSLVRQIAQRLGGSVCCTPRHGGGTCFVLSLPLAR